MSQSSSIQSPNGGNVRPAKRPAGWVAPGPAPRTPEGRVDVWPGPGEDLCYLSGDFRILQRVDGHRLSVDDLVTAAYAIACLKGSAPTRTVDLGCGIGTVLLFVAWRFPEARCVGVEAQEVSAGLARRSIAWNGVGDRVAVRFGDLRDLDVTEGLEGAELVTGTPPYLPIGTGIESSRVQCGPCRFEVRGGVEEYCVTAARLLAPGAPFVGCAGAKQRERVAAAAKGAGLVLERWRDVVPKEGKAPLFSTYALRREGEAGGFVEDAPLVVRAAHGRFSEEFDELRRGMGIPVMPAPENG